MGYKIKTIHGGYKYKKMTGLMKSYVEHFLKIKLWNSGELNQEQCDEINTAHQKLGLNIEIKPEETTDNKGLRQIAKISLNSLWGKFGQRSTLPQYEFFRFNFYV